MPDTRLTRLAATLLLALLAGCEYKNTGPSTARFVSNPCSDTGTVSLVVATAKRIDCSNGGTTVTLEGGGASYLIVPQFATDQSSSQFVAYSLATGDLAALNAASGLGAAVRGLAQRPSPRLAQGAQPNQTQIGFDHLMLSREPRIATSALRGAAALRAPSPANITQSLPALGSVRSFQVLNNLQGTAFSTVNAKLVYLGSDILLYVDTLTPANGFTPTALTNFGVFFDSTLYPIDTTAFGGPSDLDTNARVIMLMSPVVNAVTPASTCASQGYVAGFFNPLDLEPAFDPAHSNKGEVFYSIVPDTTGSVSCAHSVASVTGAVPAVFMHELQHLINFSQHVVVSGGAQGASWMDEGLSIVGEELGSVYFEQKCPPPSCRANSSQLFPDSSQGFVQSLLGDSYAYALLPDTASITLHSDDQLGFDWRGGAWLLMRYLGDHASPGFYKSLERGPSNGILDIQQAAGQSFPVLFADFGLALYTDSLPGMARATAPAANRFVSRNVEQLWARWSVTSGGPLNGFPTQPIFVFPISNDTGLSILSPGSMSFFRLDTAAGAAAVTVRFAGPGGAAFTASLKPQLAIFRLPPGQ